MDLKFKDQLQLELVTDEETKMPFPTPSSEMVYMDFLYNRYLHAFNAILTGRVSAVSVNNFAELDGMLASGYLWATSTALVHAHRVASDDVNSPYAFAMPFSFKLFREMYLEAFDGMQVLDSQLVFLRALRLDAENVKVDNRLGRAPSYRRNLLDAIREWINSESEDCPVPERWKGIYLEKFGKEEPCVDEAVGATGEEQDDTTADMPAEQPTTLSENTLSGETEVPEEPTGGGGGGEAGESESSSELTEVVDGGESSGDQNDNPTEETEEEEADGDDGDDDDGDDDTTQVVQNTPEEDIDQSAGVPAAEDESQAPEESQALPEFMAGLETVEVQGIGTE